MEDEDSDDDIHSDDEMERDEDEDFDDDDDEDDGEEDSDSDLDDISETELEEMAASTARQLLMVQMQVARASGQQGVPSMDVDERSPQERWQDFLRDLADTKVLKIMDSNCVNMNIVLPDLLETIQSHRKGISHIIVGNVFLASYGPKQQRSIFQSLWNRHSATVQYLKLGSDDSNVAISVLDIDSLLQVWTAPNINLSISTNPLSFRLTEMELCKFSIRTLPQIAALQGVLAGATSLKQLNLLGIHVEWNTVGLFDPVLYTVAALPQLDEFRLSCARASTVQFVSAACLETILDQKPKWWRLGLDGVGLQDEHCNVLATTMSMNGACKAGDLLSLTHNPYVTGQGWTRLFNVLFQKPRMGLVKVDDQSWQAKFDLVRSMNNLHGRLEFFGKDGSYPSRLHWILWLAKLSEISWEDDAHKVNYLWFSILERPDFVHL